jgi:hypothetical protein
MNIQLQNDIIEVTCLITSVFIYYMEECIKINGYDY